MNLRRSCASSSPLRWPLQQHLRQGPRQQREGQQRRGPRGQARGQGSGLEARCRATSLCLCDAAGRPVAAPAPATLGQRRRRRRRILRRPCRAAGSSSRSCSTTRTRRCVDQLHSKAVLLAQPSVCGWSTGPLASAKLHVATSPASTLALAEDVTRCCCICVDCTRPCGVTPQACGAARLGALAVQVRIGVALWVC